MSNGDVQQQSYTNRLSKMVSSFLRNVEVHEICLMLVATARLTSETGAELSLRKFGFQSSAKDYCLALIKTFAFSVS